ncbi:hypothetical protein RvY_10787 [Ramazzottius varieornatus]|uniref:Uncharacterized protein n=1 Tax=Ramazzottius varieornatus TaxID=947166 RepID=A0A1D1VJB5_RAMVA|nr:hypothetical protein RvY_10787 [Ramazzottius varieornatus]
MWVLGLARSGQQYKVRYSQSFDLSSWFPAVPWQTIFYLLVTLSAVTGQYGIGINMMSGYYGGGLGYGGYGGYSGYGPISSIYGAQPVALGGYGIGGGLGGIGGLGYGGLGGGLAAGGLRRPGGGQSNQYPYIDPDVYWLLAGAPSLSTNCLSITLVFCSLTLHYLIRF